MTTEMVVAKEVAEAEFIRFTESMDLDVDKARMDADDQKSFDEARGIVVRAIERGTLSIDDKGQPVLQISLTDPKQLTFREPTGASFMSMDVKKRDAQIGRMFALMAEMTGTPEKTLAKLPQRDLRIARTLVTLFLG
jgi:hypothetical protein